jgi:hypothetical protein
MEEIALLKQSILRLHVARYTILHRTKIVNVKVLKLTNFINYLNEINLTI